MFRVKEFQINRLRATVWWQVTDESKRLQMRLNWAAPSFDLLTEATSSVLVSPLCVCLVNTYWLHWWSPEAPDEAAATAAAAKPTGDSCVK